MRASTALFLLLGALGCGSQHSPSTESSSDSGLTSTAFVVHGRVDAMRQKFGGTSVLPLANARIVVKPDGFHPSFEGKTFAQTIPEVVLPRTAEAPFTIAHRGVALKVALVGAKQVPAQIDDGAVLYPSALENATLLHVPTAIGNEDFVRFDVQPAARELSYAVDLEGVAGLRLSASTLEMLDVAGDPVLHVAPPVAVDANGLAVVGELSVEGCAYDTSAAAPWGRPVTAPGASRCVVKVRWDDQGMTYPVLVDPAWTSAGTLATARINHTTTAWSKTGTACEDTTTGLNKCVIVTGGENTISMTRTIYSTAEIYNRTTNTWASAGGFVGKRSMHAGTGSQKLIIAGGEDTLDQLSTTAIYDGTSWTVGGLLPGGKRRGLKAVQRGALNYAFVGGESVSTGMIKLTTSSKKYDSYSTFSGTFTAGPDMLTDRGYLGLMSFVHPCSACPLSYDLIAIGGIQSGGTKLATTEIQTGSTWAAGPALTSPRQRMALAYVGSWLYVVGGGTNTIDRYDRVTNVMEQWKPAGTAATLSSGNLTNLGAASIGPFASPRLLVAGGSSVISYSTSDIFDINTGARTTTNMAAIHSAMDAVAFDDGSVIVASGGAGFGSVTNTAERFVLQAKGAACTGSGECDSGFCVDGVCCESACGQACESCNETGKAGTCVAVTGAPRGTRAACPGITTGTCGNRCDGLDRSKCNFPGAAVQCGPASCAGGIATAATFCDAAGTCKAATTTPCGAYACGATACKTSPCATNADCATGFKCDSATKTCVSAGDAGAPCTTTSDCKPSSGLTCVDNTCCTAASCSGGKKCNIAGAAGTCKLPYGTACTAATAADCPGGNCADGVCCDTACTEQCAQCNLAGALKGHCSPVPAGGTPATGKPACSGTGACAARCDGTNVATCGPFAPPSTTCAAATCTAGTATPTRYCDGVGACAPATDKPCLAYVCGATDCKSTCATTADCATGYACKMGVCVTTGELGTLCDDGSQCKSGFCVPGGAPGTSVCCTVASCADGTFCADNTTASTAGTCVKPNGATCTGKADCGSGFCVDGVCCDALCDGQCEACDVAGAVGTCTGVKGPSHGDRAKCFDGGTDPCTALQCDGSTRNKCVDFAAGPETECGTLACTDGVVTPRGRCDFKGNCKLPSMPVNCAPYLCDDKGCISACKSNADCAPKFACDTATGKCGSVNATCDADGLGSIPSDGSGRHDCAPFRCDPATGGCLTTCTKTDDCGPGNVCGGDGKCVAAAGGDTGDTGGCAVTTPGRSTGSLALMLVVAGLIARRRRALPR